MYFGVLIIILFIEFVYNLFFGAWKGGISGWFCSAVTEQRAESRLSRLGPFVEGFNFKTQRSPPPPLLRCRAGSFNEGSWFFGYFLLFLVYSVVYFGSIFFL